MIITENMMLALAHSRSTESASSSSGRCRRKTGSSSGRRRGSGGGSSHLALSSFYPAASSARNPLQIVRTSSRDAKQQLAAVGASSTEMNFLWCLVRERFLSKAKMGEGTAATTPVASRTGVSPPSSGRCHRHLPPLSQPYRARQ